MKKDSEIIKLWKKYKELSDRGLTEQYKNTRRCQQFYAGNVMDYRGDATISKGTTRMVQFQLVKPYVNSIAGFMMQLRREAKYDAVHEDRQLQANYSEYLNGVSGYFRDRADAEDHESQAQKDMVMCGYGAVEMDVSYGLSQADTDKNGQLSLRRVNPLNFGWDPMAEAPNLLDSRWVFEHKVMYLEDAKEIFEADDEDFEDVNESAQQEPIGNIGRIFVGYDHVLDNKELVNVYCFQWFEIETYYRALNPIYEMPEEEQESLFVMLETLYANRQLVTKDKYAKEDIFGFNPREKYLTMTPTLKNDVEVFMDEEGLEIDFLKERRRCYYKALLSGEVVFKKFKSPYQQGYTLQAITVDYDATRKIWTGLVNQLMEPTLYYNKGLTELMYTISANSKGGVMIERDSVDDVARFEQQWAKTDAVIIVEPGANTGGKIVPKASPMVNSGLGDIINISSEAITMTSGIDAKTFFGVTGSGVEAASLQRQRVKQVMTVLAPYFRAITLYQKNNARLAIPLVRILAENSPDRLIRIIGEDGRRVFEKLSTDGFADSYEITINEAPTSASQREETLETIVALADKTAVLGQNIYRFAVPYMNISYDEKIKLQQALSPPQPDPAQEQLQQELAALDIAGKKANLQKITAETSEKQARAALTFSESQQKHIENQAILEVPPSQLPINLNI